jgi:hypothetical protein
MAVHTYTIDNISNQPISILFQQGVDTAVGNVPQASTGLMTVNPGQKVTIEASRVNVGQLQNFSDKNLIRYSAGLV